MSASRRGSGIVLHCKPIPDPAFSTVDPENHSYWCLLAKSSPWMLCFMAVSTHSWCVYHSESCSLTSSTAQGFVFVTWWYIWTNGEESSCCHKVPETTMPPSPRCSLFAVDALCLAVFGGPCHKVLIFLLSPAQVSFYFLFPLSNTAQSADSLLQLLHPLPEWLHQNTPGTGESPTILHKDGWAAGVMAHCCTAASPKGSSIWVAALTCSRLAL